MMKGLLRLILAVVIFILVSAFTFGLFGVTVPSYLQYDFFISILNETIEIANGWGNMGLALVVAILILLASFWTGSKEKKIQKQAVYATEVTETGDITPDDDDPNDDEFEDVVDEPVEVAPVSNTGGSTNSKKGGIPWGYIIMGIIMIACVYVLLFVDGGASVAPQAGQADTPTTQDLPVLQAPNIGFNFITLVIVVLGLGAVLALLFTILQPEDTFTTKPISTTTSDHTSVEASATITVRKGVSYLLRRMRLGGGSKGREEIDGLIEQVAQSALRQVINSTPSSTIMSRLGTTQVSIVGKGALRDEIAEVLRVRLPEVAGVTFNTIANIDIDLEPEAIEAYQSGGLAAVQAQAGATYINTLIADTEQETDPALKGRITMVTVIKDSIKDLIHTWKEN